MLDDDPSIYAGDQKWIMTRIPRSRATEPTVRAITAPTTSPKAQENNAVPQLMKATVR